MELIERDSYLNNLSEHYSRLRDGIGHTIFLNGEAGVGKTSLVNHFLRTIASECIVYSGACDSLFTPRPLGPLYDIEDHIGEDFTNFLKKEKDRSLIFTAFIQKLSAPDKPVVLIFEDVHWADEATIDLVKFLGRRIHRLKCLFLLTYRDDEIHSRHALTTVFGELSADHFSKMKIDRFSKDAVMKLALARGQSGEKVYSLTGGNPFYVSEILASYSPGIPERVKDSVLAVFNRRPGPAREWWEFFSILPSSRIEFSFAKRLEDDCSYSIDDCIAAGIIVSRPGHLSFKHELFRLAIEESLSPSRRKSLHKKMLRMLREAPVETQNLSHLVHHAIYADERQVVADLSPMAAAEASTLGAHIEASKLYGTAIEYADQQHASLVTLYERHAYECYLTDQISAAINSQQRALEFWQQQKVSVKEADALRFLSTLYWFEGDQHKAFELARRSIEVLENGFPTRERALAYSNYSELNMLADNREEALGWGHKAIDLATRMEDHDIVCHSLNNVGNMLMKYPESVEEGESFLNRSLALGLHHGFDEHVARAYSSLSTSLLWGRRYSKALQIFEDGIKYCEARDLNSWKYCMSSCKAQVLFETGLWDDAVSLINSFQDSQNNHVKIRIATTLARLEMRRGRFDEARVMISQVKSLAMQMHEAQRIVPVLTAELELCWLTGDQLPIAEIKYVEDTLFKDKTHSWYYTELVYWMVKCGLTPAQNIDVKFTTPLQLERQGYWLEAAERWSDMGCRYEQALALFEDSEENQKEALVLLHRLGAVATYEMLKQTLKGKGVKNIPRGIRESTRSNPAQLTTRQIDVLFLLKDGLQNAEIADKLFISVKTVDHHIASIFSKLNVNDRRKAVTEARKLGITA